MTVTDRFLSDLALAEQKLRAGEYGPELNALVADLQALVEDHDVVAILLADGEAELAERFDAIVQAGKELRDEAREALHGLLRSAAHDRDLPVAVGVKSSPARVLAAGSAASEIQDMEPAETEPEVWVRSTAPGPSGSFFNATENRRLAALGLVPLAPELAGDAVPPNPSGLRLSEAPASGRAQTQRRKEMPAVAEKPPAKKPVSKKSGLAGLSKANLKAKLLATPTIPDGAWKEACGAPEREKGETREQYIKRVLA